MKTLVFATLVLAACAFPPSVGPPPPDACACAGQCLADGSCRASKVGETCRLGGDGVACEGLAQCIGGVCTAACTGSACGCDVLHCAGQCANGSCVASPLGGPCDPTGDGPACAEGRCVEGTCAKDGAPVPLASYLATVRTNFCDYLVRCDRWPASLRAACEEALFPTSPTFDTDAEAAALAAKAGTDYDPQAAGDCLGAFPTLGCRQAYPAACDRMFGGRAKDGERCTGTSACDAASWCRLNDVTGLRCEGLCTARAKEGEDCSENPCDTSLACVDEGADPATPVKRCRTPTPPASVGNPCGNGRQACLGDTYCAADSGNCERRRLENEDCDNAFGCADGLACAIVNRTKATCLPLRKLGERCDSHQQCTPLTMQVAVAACIGGTCRPLPASGACVDDPWLPNGCDPVQAFCGADKLCHPLAGEGAPCVSEADCGPLSNFICSFGACRARLSCE